MDDVSGVLGEHIPIDGKIGMNEAGEGDGGGTEESGFSGGGGGSGIEQVNSEVSAGIDSGHNAVGRVTQDMVESYADAVGG